MSDATMSRLETMAMQSQDKLADFLRAYIKDEAPGDIWQVVSADISNVLRKLIALSAECQRAKLELDRLKKSLEPSGEREPRRYFPLRNPLANGDQGSSANPYVWAIGTSSRSRLRSSRWYGGCSLTNRFRPSSFPTQSDSTTCQAAKLLLPI